ncbi:ribose-5-phosphate isomerase RpiA [Pedobacter sp. UC225_65]|uniref:ribose-5-phosphate isomerase RpiA n=1 Tax=Pedobacter sp. UC225_65 TaxID=3350173 RepID=UPI00366D77AD
MPIQPENNTAKEKLEAAKAAVALVKDHDIVGLGTGTTATFAIQELAKRVKAGLQIKGVPSSVKTATLASTLGIELLELGTVSHIDISIDGADEFTEQLNLIKGGGGALFREKVVASLSKNSIIITDASKKVEKLGAFKVPVEVVPIAYQYVIGQLEKLNGIPILRLNGKETYQTDNHNYIVDVDFGLIDDAEKLSIALDQIVGVFAHGLFVGLTAQLIMAKDGNLVKFIKPK